MKSIEDLLKTPYWIIDILPERVEKDSPGQYFAIERYYLSAPRIAEIKKRHTDIVLKLNCYRNVSLDEEEETNPDPERIAEAMMKRHVCILSDDSLIISEPDETWLTVYNVDEALLHFLETLCIGEGLYLFSPE